MLWLLLSKYVFFRWPPVWFDWPLLVWWHNQLNLFRCLIRVLLCLHSLTFFINSLHSSYNSLLIWSFSSSIHISLKCVNMSIMSLMDVICSFIGCFSALHNIFTSQGVLMLLFSFRLFRVIFWLRHLRVNLLWLLKSPIFFCRCSHLLKMDVSHSAFNSVYDTRSGFSINRIKY